MFSIVEIFTVYGYSIVGELASDENNVITVTNPLLLYRLGNNVQVLPVGITKYINTLQIDKTHILSMAVIDDQKFISEYNSMILELRSKSAGLIITSQMPQ